MAREARIRVLVADDHVMVRAGLKRLIDEQGDMEVVSEAADGGEAARLVEACGPDVLLIDVSMPGDGVTTTRKISAACSTVRIIAVTRHDDEGFVEKMLSAGASGYVLKQSPSSELVQAIRTVAEGRQYIDPGIRRMSAAAAAAAAAGPVAVISTEAMKGEPLSRTEEDVLRLIASSWSNHRIGEHLKLDAERVAAVKTSAMQKTGLLTRLQVLNYARARGWLKGS